MNFSGHIEAGEVCCGAAQLDLVLRCRGDKFDGYQVPCAGRPLRLDDQMRNRSSGGFDDNAGQLTERAAATEDLAPIINTIVA
jgi:hypothetical protein